jgi:hypothetical protein
MRRRLLSFIFALLVVAPATAKAPDTLSGSEGCDYLVQNFSGSYPDEKERMNWECYDQKSTFSIACTYVRGDDILKYSDVYRKRTSPSAGSGGPYGALRNRPDLEYRPGY